jgi:hypothetical protein
MMHWVSKRIGTAYNNKSNNDNESESCHETHRVPLESEEASLAGETTMSPRRLESCAEAKFAVATARKRAMVVLVMVRFMLVLGLERKVLCLCLYWLC